MKVKKEYEENLLRENGGPMAQPPRKWEIQEEKASIR